MNPFAFLFSWYNLPFTVALGCGLLLALLQLASGFGGGDGDGDAGGAADAESTLESAADADSHIASDTHANATGIADAANGGAGLLALLGIGRVPLMIVLIALLGSLGALGLLANSVISAATGAYPGALFLPVLLGSLLLALPLTRAISGGLARLTPRSSTAVGFEQLVGRAGVVVSPRVSRSYGRVAVRDSHGTIHTVFAVVDGGEALSERSEVALLAYDQTQRRFVVRALRRS